MPETTLQEDINSFRNIIKILKKFNSVGDTDPSGYFGSLSSDDEDSCTEKNKEHYENHYPCKIKCEIINSVDFDVPINEIDNYDEFMENAFPEDCCIFYSLYEIEPDENGNPQFESDKSWWGCNDFSSTRFTYNSKLQLWACEYDIYFRFLNPVSIKCSYLED
jgi:hypothetical protein